MANYLMGCDVGTSGTKSVLIDEEGSALASHYVEYPLNTPRPGWAEQDPEWYWNAVADTIRSCIAQAGVDAAEIRGVSVSALAPACILVDKDLRPLQDAHIWMDRRGIAEAQWVREKVGEDRVFEVSASVIDPFYTTVKVLWEKNNRPDLYNKAHKIMPAAGYAAMKLTGRAVTDYTNASMYGICYDIRNKEWDGGIIERLGLDAELFPQSYPCDEVIGEVTAEAAARTGLKKGTPVMAGTVDATASFFAGGAVEDGDISLAMGTSGCLGIVHSEPKFTRGVVPMVHVSDSRNKYAAVGATVSCGSLLRYFRDEFAQVERQTADELSMDVYDVICMEAEKVPAGSDGLIALPYFMGERSPIWDPAARGVLFGMSLTHTRGHMVRALMEGAVYALYQNFLYVKETGIKMNMPMTLGDGGAKSPLWRQIVADMFNVPVAYMENSRGAPLGSAVNAGVGAGVFQSHGIIKDWLRVSDRHEPDAQTHETYMKYYEIFDRLYGKLKDEYTALAKATGYH